MKNKNLLFVSLFGLTEVYQAIAKRLTERGFNIFWTSTNQYWTHLLTEGGVPRERILQLVYSRSDFLDDVTMDKLSAEMVECEAGCDLTFNQCLLMDRFLMRAGSPDLNKYVCLYYRDLKQFLTANDIGWVFAEPTNLNEMMTYMLCRELNIKFVSPRDMRFPSGRMVFFEGYLQHQIIPRVEADTSLNGRELIETFAQKQSVPFYFDRFKGARIVQPKKITESIVRRSKMIRILRQPSLTHYSVGGRLKLIARRVTNSFYMKHVCRYDKLEEIKGRVAYYGLHVQPENSVDVLGSYVSDQLKLLKDIRRALPYDTTLVVKEHPTFLGQRSARFFRELKRIPNLRLVHHDVSSFELYRRADLVVTVSGTTAYEAGLLGVPAITFSPIYFDRLSSVHYCCDMAELKPLVHRLMSSFERDFEADCDFMSELVGNSYDALWSDPFFDETVMAECNIENLTRAFLDLVHDDRA